MKKHMTSMARQIHEAVRIAETKGSILNSKDEYSRCIIPTISAEGGANKGRPKPEQRERIEVERSSKRPVEQARAQGSNKRARLDPGAGATKNPNKVCHPTQPKGVAPPGTVPQRAKKSLNIKQMLIALHRKAQSRDQVGSTDREQEPGRAPATPKRQRPEQGDRDQGAEESPHKRVCHHTNTKLVAPPGNDNPITPHTPDTTTNASLVGVPHKQDLGEGADQQHQQQQEHTGQGEARQGCSGPRPEQGQAGTSSTKQGPRGDTNIHITSKEPSTQNKHKGDKNQPKKKPSTHTQKPKKTSRKKPIQGTKS